MADSDRALRAARLTAQRLAGPPARSAEEVVRDVLAVQAQDGRGARLAVRCRSVGLAAADVDDALTASRSLVITWLNRGTLHLVTANDYWWLHPLTTPQVTTANNRRLLQEGVSPAQADRGVEVVTAAVADAPRTRAELRQLLDDAGVPTAGQALVHVLLAASLRGHIVRGPMRGVDHAYVSVTDWLGPPPEPVDRGDALAMLARRYLRGHGPATGADLAKWAGITQGDARKGLTTIADEVARFDDTFVLIDRSEAGLIPAPRLLGAFDPLLHGWVSRAPFVGEHSGVVTSNGLFRPVALVDGKVVATWGLAGGRVSVKRLERISKAARDALVADAADVLRFLGLPPQPAVVD